MQTSPGGHTLNLNQYAHKILGQCHSLEHLKQFQAFLITLGHSHTQFFIFKLLRFCTLTLAEHNYARFIFDHLSSPNSHLYTAMITGYASRPDHLSAFLLYRRMVRVGNPPPNHFIYPHVLKSCPQVLDSLGTELLHCQIIKSGFVEYPVVQTALLDSYSKLSSGAAAARKIFDEMRHKNVVAWTAMISACARLGAVGEAVQLFKIMPDKDVPAWNAVISGCTQNGFFPEAINFFKSMVALAWERQDRPNQVTILCALSACGHTGMLRLGEWIHSYVYRNGLGPNLFISNALVDMYGKCGDLVVARRVFDAIPEKNLTSWNSMINCFALHGWSESAVNLFEEMIKHGDGVRPDNITFVGLLNACTHGGLVEKGSSYFVLMNKEYGIEPEIEHYGCLIDLLSRAGRFKEAMDVVREMNTEPDEVVWGALLNASKIHGYKDLAEFSMKRLVEIDPENDGYVVMLANMYVEMGKWEDARKTRKMLEKQNGYKIPGCSWIEIDNSVHQFYSLDKTHPKTKHIYEILGTLSRLVRLEWI